MGAPFSKVLLRPGVHHAPQGRLEAPPSRMRAWADKFAKMKAAGIRVPVAWSHAKGALPYDKKDRAHNAFLLSKYNAGYVEDMAVDANGDLAGHLDVPGCELDGDKLVTWAELPDGRKVKTAIGEVSVKIQDWKDGQGRDWEDSIVHVALSPHPVIAGQGGFSALSLDPSAGFTLSLDTWEGAMPEADKEDRASSGPPEKRPPPAAAAAAKTDFFPEALTLLAKHGIPLPPGTNAENFPERLWITLHALQEGDAKPDGEDEDDGGDEEGAAYEGEQTKEESRPVMMSLSTAKTEKDRTICRKEQERHKERQLALVNRLVKLAIMPGHEGKRLTAALSEYELALDEETLEPVTKELDLELSVWEKIAQNIKPDLLKKAKAEPPPHEQAPRISQEEINRRAERVSAVK